MKHMSSIPSEEEMNIIISRFGLPELNEDMFRKPVKPGDQLFIKNSYNIAEFVYDSCSMLIPKLWRRLPPSDGFKEDIITHLMVNARITDIYHSSTSKIKSNHEFCEEYKNFTEDIASYNKSQKAYKIILDKQISKHLRLKTSKQKHKKNQSISEQYDIPYAFFPYVFFMVFNIDFHNNLKLDSTFNLQSVQERIEMFQNTFEELFSLYQENGLDQTRHDLSWFTSTKFDELILLNSVLFEREYNVMLSTQIAAFLQDIFSEVEDKSVQIKFIKTISLFSLLPNVISRTKYIDNLERDLYLAEYESGNYQMESLHDLQESILQLALVAIPVMEAYYTYILNRDSIKLYPEKVEFDVDIVEDIVDQQLMNEVYASINKTITSGERTNIMSLLDIESVDIDKFETIDSIYHRAAIESLMTYLDFRKLRAELGI